VKRIVLVLLILGVVFSVKAVPSVWGFEGGAFLPSPGAPEVGNFNMLFWRENFSFEENYGKKSYYRSIIGATYTFLPGLELGILKKENSCGRIPDDALMFAVKYTVPQTGFISTALGFIADLEDDHYSSLFITFGDRKVYFGVGANVSGSDHVPWNPAPLGGYDFGEQKPDPFFFFVGVNYEFKEGVGVSVEFDGDKTIGSFFWERKDGYFMKVYWRGDGDYDTLMKMRFGSSYDSDQWGIIIGGRI